jgi:hypothetical protein
MSYIDFDEKIENEIIGLYYLKKYEKEEKNDGCICLDSDSSEEEEIEKNKKSEQLKNECLKLYFRIDEGKNKELESAFKTPKLILKDKYLKKLGKDKFYQFKNDELIIYENKFINKLFNIKIEKEFNYLSLIELDNHDIIFLTKKNTEYKLLIYRLKDSKYSLLQELEEDAKGYEPQRIYSCCKSRPKEYKMNFLEKISGNKFISISNYGYKIYALNKNNEYSLVLMDIYWDGELKIYEINENKFIFCVKKYIRTNYGGPAHDYIKIEEVQISNKTKSEKEIIPSLKLESSYTCLFKYSTWKQEHTLSDYIILNNKYFLIFVDNHLLIINLIQSELVKRYIFPKIFNYNIQKWNKTSDNEFLVIKKDYITLLELKENNSNGKIALDLKVIGYTNLPFDDYSSFVKLDENRFYIETEDEILLY